MVDDHHVPYSVYIIKPKLDFPPNGFLLNGEWIKAGYVVVHHREGSNVMPGATWFTSVDEARIGCDALDLAKDICRHSEKDVPATFWRLIALSRRPIRPGTST
jgi:hypothetical protein